MVRIIYSWMRWTSQQKRWVEQKWSGKQKQFYEESCNDYKAVECKFPRDESQQQHHHTKPKFSLLREQTQGFPGRQHSKGPGIAGWSSKTASWNSRLVHSNSQENKQVCQVVVGISDWAQRRKGNIPKTKIGSNNPGRIQKSSRYGGWRRPYLAWNWSWNSHRIWRAPFYWQIFPLDFPDNCAQARDWGGRWGMIIIHSRGRLRQGPLKQSKHTQPADPDGVLPRLLSRLFSISLGDHDQKVSSGLQKGKKIFFFFSRKVCKRYLELQNCPQSLERLWRKPFWKLCPDTGTASTDLPGTSCPNTTGCFLWMRGENYWLLTLTLMRCLTVWNNVFIKKYGFNAWLKKCVRNYPDC